MSWRITAFADKATIEAALREREEVLDWGHDIGLSGFEMAEDRPNDWRLDAYLPRQPRPADQGAIAALFAAGAPPFTIEQLPETDWVTLSQAGVEPIRAGRFYIHTPDYPHDSGAINFIVPASQAFGTGQHETTAGCLEMLDAIEHSGFTARNIADIGTGTGLLAFAAAALWPPTFVTASDIDPICEGVFETNAGMNDLPLGPGMGEICMVIADGMADTTLQSRAPYDLLIANILAAPLIDLAADFAETITPGGQTVLAGLLTHQEEAVLQSYYAAGFALIRSLHKGDWSILWLEFGGTGNDTGGKMPEDPA